MKFDVEKRLHRVKISLDKSRMICPYSQTCDKAVNCDRCNLFYEKCSIFKKNQ